jgi:hypothetical protein
VVETEGKGFSGFLIPGAFVTHRAEAGRQLAHELIVEENESAARGGKVSWL